MSKIVSWFKNYWYYYKWTVIIAVFFIAVILFCLFNTGDKTEYDVSVLYTGPCLITSDQNKSIGSVFSQIVTHDKNGDGKKNADFISYPAFTYEQIDEAVKNEKDPAQASYKYSPYTVNNVEPDFSKQFMAGVASVCLLDPYWYDIALKSGALMPLSEVLGYTPDGLVDEYSIRFSDLKVSKWFEEFDVIPDDTVLCFRKVTTAASFTGKDIAQKNYEAGKQFICDLFAFSAE